AHLQRTLRSGWSWYREVGEWRLSQIESLHRAATVTTAKHFLPGLTVGCFHHVAINSDCLTFVAVAQRRRQQERGVGFVTGQRRVVTLLDAGEHHQLGGHYTGQRLFAFFR